MLTSISSVRSMASVSRIFSLLCVLSVSNGISQNRNILYGKLSDEAFLNQLKKLNTLETPQSAVTPQAVSQSLLEEIKEIYPIVKPPSGIAPCTVYLLKGRVFSKSSLFQSQYAPPLKCGTNWATVILTVYGQSDTYQYDQILSIFLDKLLLVKTSTPVSAWENGTKWTVNFDVTKYSAYLKQSRSITANLPVYLSSTVTGVFNITAYLSFFPGRNSARNPNVIIPLSKGSASLPSSFQLTRSTSSALSAVTIPQNSYRVLCEISVLPSSSDAFPYFSVPRSYAKAFPYLLSNLTVFHEVQVRIDGSLAGTVFPKPIIFPSQALIAFFAKTVGIGAFNIPTYFVDVTPFVGKLVDGKSHNFAFTIPNIANDSYWSVAGALHIWVDPKVTKTSGKLISSSVPAAAITIASSVPTNSFNVESGNIRVLANASSRISGFVVTSFGNLTTTVTVQKSFDSLLRSRGFSVALESTQKTAISSRVVTKDKSGKVWYSLTESSDYPFSITIEGFFTLFVSYNQGISSSRTLLFLPGYQVSSKLSTRQTGSGFYDSFLGSLGNAEQTLAYSDSSKECYTRNFDVGAYALIFSDTTLTGTC